EARVELTLGALHLDVDLSIPSGGVVAVVGPNGAGKTTLLRALAGLQPLDAGRVVLDGVVLEDTGTSAGTSTYVVPERRPVGIMFQNDLLFPHLSALENVAFGLRCRGVRTGEARRLAAGWLERLGLDDHASAVPAALSGGQARRVALARALATEPRLLLLDEPLAALDASTLLETRRALRHHLDGYAGIRVIVTHDPVEASALADRVIVVEGGEVVQAGTLAEISARPRSRYVADLVGVNLLEGTGVDGGVDLAGGGHLVAPGVEPGPVFVVIHPRAVTLNRDPPGGTPRNVWRGVAQGVDREGERARVVVGGRVRIVAEVTAAAVDELRLDEGGDVWVAVKATEVGVFPA
ncbi:MAG: molybdate transport system ATP-binding protein, partial [Actinomycetota bacterium]|nr:molybdate transport system ATP-binding protein [Actinomycetota bacterium]